MFHERRSSDIMRSTPQRNMNGGQRSGRSTNSSTNGDMDFSLSINQDALPVTSVAVPISTGAQLLINACGRTVALEMQCARTILDLQSALQTKLQMEAQTFHFFDVHGATLATDAQVHDAITQGATPLCATLTDASIHFIENRREELAQMQWKLVRDQMTVVNGKMSALARQGNDTKGQLEQFRQETTNLIERGQKETLWSIETVQKQLDNLSDTLETERGARRQDLAMHMSIIQDLRGKLDAERVAREELKDQHAFEIRSLVEKADAFQKHVTDMLRDQHMGVAKTVDGLHKQFQGNVRLLNQLRADVDQTQQETKTHFVEIEEGCSGLETRIADMSKKQSATTERFAERQERIAQLVQTLQNDGKQCQDQVLVAHHRVADLEARLVEMEAMTRELVVQEREGRDDQMRRTQRVLHCEQKRQLSELEEKIADRFERESCERERNVQQIFEEVGKGSPNKAFTPARGISMPARPDAGSAERVEVFTTSNLEASVASSTPGRLSPPATLSAVAVAPNGPTALALTQQVTRSSLGALQMQMQPAARTSLSPVPMAPRSATQTSLSPSPAGSRVMVRPPDGNQLLATTSSNGSSRGASVNMQAPGAPRMVSPPPSRGASINLQAADKPFMGQAIQARISPSPTPLRQSTPGTR
mmetsp:Transcript_83171/g.137545  ORF Transcript_83171/g.137545 Transcript_83171/m.137545 type:complete len:650 (-) Transcript_83171:60-2009(-)